MKYKLNAIKIEQKALNVNTDEVSNMYIIKMDYELLIKICGIGKVSINREVDPNRARKMVKYIREKESFYPPIIVATTKKNLIVYDEEKKIIYLDSEKLKTDHDLLVIDGQHRYTSIKFLAKEDKNLIKDRYQSLFLIDNLNEFQQRKIFIDINNNAKKVTTGTKLRLEKNLINYVSLNVVDNSGRIQNKIVMDDNQTSSTDDIPYKFIIRGNEKLLKKIDECYDKDLLNLSDIDKVLGLVYFIWNKIFDIIDSADTNDCLIVTNEAFYIALCEYLQGVFNSCVFIGENGLKDKIEEKDYENTLSTITCKIEENIRYINTEYYKKDLSRAKERCNEIANLLNKVINESEESNA